MERPSTRTLDITIISGEDLRIRGRSVKRRTYVTIRPDSNSSPYSGPAAKDCLRTKTEQNPLWNDKLLMELPLNMPFIRAEVYSTSATGKDHSLVGTAWIPVTDFAGENYLHMLSYRLKDRNGDRNGVLNLSIRALKQQPATASLTMSFPNYGCGYGYGYEVGRDNKSCGGGLVALGIPVSHPYPYPSSALL